jgi:hypothetical protein
VRSEVILWSVPMISTFWILRPSSNFDKYMSPQNKVYLSLSITSVHSYMHYMYLLPLYYQAQDGDQWRDLVNDITNIWVPQNVGKFYSGWATGSFSRRIHLHGITIAISNVLIVGSRGSVLGWGTMRLAGRLRVRFPMKSLNFSIDLVFPAALWPYGGLGL